MTAVSERRASLRLPAFGGGRFYVWLTLVALAVAALSLIFPSTPSYDPWSWLIWGREIFHGHLTIAGGSSWKPLPVIFTTVFTLFGSAQPNLWLVVARAGAVISVLMTVKLAMRITWNLTVRGRASGWIAEAGWGERLVALTPAVFAGAIALVGTTLTNSFPGNMLLGYSEGVMVAAALIAVERAWDGHHRQAFALGIIPSLDRPEFWIIWGPYGLWVMWRDRRAIPLVLGLGALMLLLWIVPQKLGGGTVVGLAKHAQQNHSRTSAVNTSFPFWNELAYKVWPLAIERVEFAALIEMALTAFLVFRARRALGSWWAAIRRHGAAVAAAVSATAGFLWWILIAIETQAGFAGNPRYAILGVMLIYAGGAAAYGWACVGLGRLVAALASRLSAVRQARVVPAAGGALLMILVFLFVPGWFAHRMPSIASIRYEQRYQAQLRERVASLIQRAGGPKKVMGCGSVMTNNLQVTMVAWYLDVPIPWVQSTPQVLTPGNGRPNVVFQDAASSGGDLLPSPQQMQTWSQGWERSGSRYRVLRTGQMTLYMDCSAYSNVNLPASQS